MPTIKYKSEAGVYIVPKCFNNGRHETHSCKVNMRV